MDLKKIGQARLCLRLPALRDRIRSHDALALELLFESYAKTTEKRDNERQNSAPDPARLTELDAQCRRIEDDVCLLLQVARGSRVNR